MTEPIIPLASVELKPRPAEFLPESPTRRPFDVSTARLGERMGLKRMGATVVAVKPGAAGWPFHNHRVNDEMFVMLAGHGELRLGRATHAVKPGDVIGCPAGGPEGAHQLVNTGADELRYLAISTSLDPEICEYPDSRKIAAYHGQGASGLYHMSRAADQRDYWDGE